MKNLSSIYSIECNHAPSKNSNFIILRFDRFEIYVWRIINAPHAAFENFLFVVIEITAFEEDLTGNNIEYVYTDDVPAVGDYYKIRYTCYAVDSKGGYASAVFWITVLPAPLNPAPYEVLEYTNDSILAVCQPLRGLCVSIRTGWEVFSCWEDEGPLNRAPSIIRK